MTKYILKRILFGLLSAMTATIIIMVLVYSLMDRDTIFSADPMYNKQINNSKETYMHQRWEEYGYLDYVTYADFMREQKKSGNIDLSDEEFSTAVKLGRIPEKDSALTAEYTAKFKEYYEARGYEVTRLDAVTAKGNGKGKLLQGGAPALFASKDKPLIGRVFNYFAHIITVDNIHYVDDNIDIGKRELKFTLKDPAYGGEKFSPAIMGNGTKHKYLLYFDKNFPYIHQNLVSVNLGVSYSVNQGIDIFVTSSKRQGSYMKSEVHYPTGLVENSADDLHTAEFVAGSLEKDKIAKERFTDDYTLVRTAKSSMSKFGFSFTLGIIASVISYLLGLPLGILMARKKDKLIDKFGTLYIVFSIAIPSLAYIFIVKALGNLSGLPSTFDLEHAKLTMYILPIISLSLPQIANLMKWMRRFMIDQSNSDYVRFARSGGLSESEIFKKHIFKNAVIPLVHGIPATVLAALTGAFYTESVYVVPGFGKMFINAIQQYDNAVIIGIALFYALISVISLILGDLLMSLVDPRISFVEKAR